MARKRGRPPKDYLMTNGHITSDVLFLFTPKDTIPGHQINRFLQLCDEHIKELTIEELTVSDIDEVAQYNRTRMLKDFILKNMTNPVVQKGPEGEDEEVEPFTDLGFITQLEKLHKQMDKHIENLKVRRKDRILGKTSGSYKGLGELARELDEDPQRLDHLVKKSKKEITQFSQEYVDSDPLSFIENMSKNRE
jgi:hypothetical protein